MANEQLAVLLNSYLERLEAISGDIETGLPDGAERALQWWHEGKRATDWGWGNWEELESKGYELKSTGELLILVDLKKFISSLQRDVHNLNPSLSKRTKI